MKVVNQNEEKKQRKEVKPKLTEYEKRKLKRKKQNDLLNMRGIPKYITIYIVEVLFIFLTEMIVKMLLGSLTLDYTILRIFLSSCLISLVISLITCNMPLRLRRTLLIIVDAFISIYAWVQIGLVNFLGGFISLGNAEQGTKVTDYIAEFFMSFKPSIHLLFIPLVLVVLYLVFERYITRDGFEKKFPFKNLVSSLAVIVYMALLTFGYYVTIEVDFMQNKLQSVSNKKLFTYPSNPNLAVKNFGTTVYFMLDVKGIIKGEEIDYTLNSNNPKNPVTVENIYKREIDDEAWNNLIKIEENKDLITLNNYFINRTIYSKNEYTGLFKDKNLVMIMMESISEAVFHEEYKEFFPTLYKLYTEGITGVNNYSPRNNCATGDSEMTSVTSLYSVGTTCTPNTYKNNEYQQALLYMLRNNGYYTSAYHDYIDQYYSRSTFEYKYGAYRYYGVTDLGMSYNPAYKEWPSDLVFMEKALPKFIDQNKFASYMVTVTAHTPYIYSSEMGDKHLSLFKDTDYSIYMKRYLSKVKELDLAVEHLLKTLEDKGKLDDTVIVLFGDHYPYGLSDKDYQRLAPYDVKEHSEIDRTPFIIYNSQTTGQKITKYTTPIDYAPTLLNLFGIDYDPRYYMGHDVFSDYTDYAVFPDNSWQSSLGYYDATKGEFFPAIGSTYDPEVIIDLNAEIADMRSMSTLAIKKNYFKYLFDYFQEYEKLKREKEQQEAEEEMERLKEQLQATEETQNKEE